MTFEEILPELRAGKRIAYGSMKEANLNIKYDEKSNNYYLYRDDVLYRLYNISEIEKDFTDWDVVDDDKSLEEIVEDLKEVLGEFDKGF